MTLWSILHVSAQGSHIVIQGSVKDYRVAYRSDVTDMKWQVFTDVDLTIPAKEWHVELSQGEAEKRNEVQIKWLTQGKFYLMVDMTGKDGCPNKKAWPFIVEPPVIFSASAYCINEEAFIRWNTTVNGYDTDSLCLRVLKNDGSLIMNIDQTSLEGKMPWPKLVKSDSGEGEDVLERIDFVAHFDDIPVMDDISVLLLRPDCSVDRIIALNDSVDVWHNISTKIDVLGNDYDSNGEIDSSSVQIVSYTNNGSLNVNGDGSVNYKPDVCFFETDSFSYYIENEHQDRSNIATVYVNVKINPESDMDEDGIADIDENIVGSNNLCDTDTDMDGIPNYLDPDDDGDGIATIDEPGDLNDNGIPDYLEVWNSAAVDDYAKTGVDVPVWISVLDNDSSTMVAATLHIDMDVENGYSYINSNDYNVNYSPDFDFLGEDSLYYVVCDHYGKCDTAKVFISVEDLVMPPQVFTPNNDGYNETFVIDNLDHYPENHLVVFNRWGNKVYEKSGYKNNWAGDSNVKHKIGGNSLPVGVYYYVLKYANNRIKQGGVYLER